MDTSLIEKINERFQIDIYQSIEQYKSQLKVDEDDDTRFVVSDYQDDTSVYFSESLGSDDNYFVYLSLGQDIGENWCLFYLRKYVKINKKQYIIILNNKE